ISLPGRFLVYVPDGTTSGISRKLPDTERNRLKNLLKDIVPDSAGVIVRTAAEGASEQELTRDVERLTARWADIEKKSAGGNAPQLLYGEPDLTLKVVRDLFTEDFKKLVISGDESWDMVQGYVSHVAPDLADRLERYDGERDVFAEYRIDEQIQKALDRKVWLPSGGSLVIDRTEAMTVVDVNTGKFTGSGGNLEETVTKNNLEAAEEIVRQLRLRDIGGIIVVDFIDMVLESNRDLVLRRLVECLGRDRTRHQVAEVTSLGLVQMTRKRIGTGLLEAFSESCEHCGGRGLVLHHEPVEPKKKTEEEPRRGRRSGRGRGREDAAASGNGGPGAGVPSPKDIAAMARHEEASGEEKHDGAIHDGVAAGSATDQPAEPTAEKPAEPSVEKPAVPTAEPAEPTRAEARARKDEDRQPTAEVPDDEKAAEQGEKRDEPADLPVGAGAHGPGGEQDAAAETAEPVTPPAPKVVTTVRRRSARRPAGPAVSTSGAASEPQASLMAPGDAISPAEETAEDPADGDVLAPLVDAAEEEPSVDGAEEAASFDVAEEQPSVDGAEHEEGAQDAQGTPHVPVKRRGSRRR
ncbi:MAG TPA: Rne/Rng family ribonuclease, partial [Nocardioidaceae bacterium]